jgi:hypothetical protein
MKTTVKCLALLIVNSLLWSGCTKYEHSTSISLRSVVERIDEKWIIEKATDLNTGGDITSDYSGEIWEFIEEGPYKVNDIVLGSWSLTNNDENITINLKTGGTTVYRILRLTAHELWLEEANKVELHMECY